MAGPLSGTTVLVVEDDPDNAELLAMYLDTSGALVRTAGGGPEALELVSSWKPDVMLLDISLPGMDGYELLRTIRLDPELRMRPAVAVTAHAYERDKQRAVQAGFSVHVAKPFDGEALVHLIARLTRKTPAGDDPPQVRDFRAVRDMQGVREALGFLNRRSRHRFHGRVSIRRSRPFTQRRVSSTGSTPRRRREATVPIQERRYCSIVQSRPPAVLVVGFHVGSAPRRPSCAGRRCSRIAACSFATPTERPSARSAISIPPPFRRPAMV